MQKSTKRALALTGILGKSSEMGEMRAENRVFVPKNAVIHAYV